MLPDVHAESDRWANTIRQVEIFTYDHKLFLRIGPIGDYGSGKDRYTVELPSDKTSDLIAAIERGMDYLAWPRS